MVTREASLYVEEGWDFSSKEHQYLRNSIPRQGDLAVHE